jgi:hypothetical protein
MLCYGPIRAHMLWPNRDGRTGDGSVEWMFVGGLGIIWAAFLYAPRNRRASPHASVQEFERTMGLLAETERATGRWIVAPRKGVRFVGGSARNRRRARERRRRVFMAMLEATGLTFLIGLFPPLREMWVLTAALAGLLVLYVCVLLKMKQIEAEADGPVAASADEARPVAPPRDLHDEMGSLGPDDLVHVVVHPVRELQVAGI